MTILRFCILSQCSKLWKRCYFGKSYCLPQRQCFLNLFLDWSSSELAVVSMKIKYQNIWGVIMQPYFLLCSFSIFRAMCIFCYDDPTSRSPFVYFMISSSLAFIGVNWNVRFSKVLYLFLSSIQTRRQSSITVFKSHQSLFFVLKTNLVPVVTIQKFFIILISRSFKKRARDNTISYFHQSFRFSGLWLILARELGRSGQNKSWGTENRERTSNYFFLNFEQCKLKKILDHWK